MEEPIQKVGRLAKLKQIIVIGVPAVIESIISGLPRIRRRSTPSR